MFEHEHGGDRPDWLAPTDSWTHHIQGYLQLTKQQRRSTLSAAEELEPRIHWIEAKGNSVQNREYCSKEGALR